MLLRSFGSRALAAGVVAIAASGLWGGSGCSITKPTEIVPGALSQIAVPVDLAGLRIEVIANGQRAFLDNYAVQNGVAFLPATLGVISGGQGGVQVTVILAGYNQEAVSLPNGEYQQDITDITEVGQNPDSPSVRRGSIQTYVGQHTLFLPMNLSYSCWGTSCSTSGTAGDTCKGNTCTSSQTDSSKLVDFDPSLIDGTQECFSPSSCFTPVTTAVLLDSNKCLYEVPPDQVAGLGLNVRILYQDLKFPTPTSDVPIIVQTSEQEILNVEAAGSLMEGFSIPDPNKPLQFQLAPGLCTLVQNATNIPPGVKASGKKYHSISAVQVSTTCPSKLPLLPICAAEQNVPAIGADGGPTTSVVCNQPITLDPAPSAIYMVMDNSSIMSGAFGPQGYATAMGLSLSNPVFKRTYVAFDFLDHNQADCTATSTSYTTPGSMKNSLDFTLANVAQPSIAGFLQDVVPPDPGPDGGVPAGGFAPLYLEPAMRLDDGVYKHLQDFTASLQEQVEIGAALFFVNRQPDSTGAPGIGSGDAGSLVPTGVDCDPALDTAMDTNAQSALEQQIVAADKAGLQSWFVILNNSLYQVGTPLQYFKDIQTAVKAQGVSTMQVLDATQPKTDAATVLGSFSNVVTGLGTCLYELPTGVDTSATMYFTLPIPSQVSPTAPLPVQVKANPSCTAATQSTGGGWNIEGAPGTLQHIRICGTDCSNLRQSVLAVSAAALTGDAGTGAGDAGGATVPEVPVTVTMPCVDAGM